MQPQATLQRLKARPYRWISSFRIAQQHRACWRAVYANELALALAGVTARQALILALELGHQICFARRRV
jgi:hypothetical protein